MSRLMRTSEVTKRPVVTLAGEDIAQIKDVVYAAGGGAVGGFTLAGRGRFAGPLSEALAWSSVSALGSHAAIVVDEGALMAKQDVIDASAASGGSGGNILGSRVLTDTGTDLGKVVDVIIEVSPGSEHCDVVGYEVDPSEALGNHGTRVLLPLPDTLAASGEHLMVPQSATEFVRSDLAGFGAAVDDFRSQLRGAQS